MEPKVYIDGTLYPKKKAKISVFDHGLLYGDGVFEGIRVYSGRIFRFAEHMDRLYEGAAVIRLQIPLSRPKLEQAVHTFVWWSPGDKETWGSTRKSVPEAR